MPVAALPGIPRITWRTSGAVDTRVRGLPLAVVASETTGWPLGESTGYVCSWSSLKARSICDCWRDGNAPQRVPTQGLRVGLLLHDL
jgi:hypothetical protein